MKGLPRGIAAALVACALAAPAGAAGRSPPGVGAADALERSVLAEINGFRARHELSPLRLDARLGAAADSHALAMARGGFFAHESADGST